MGMYYVTGTLGSVVAGWSYPNDAAFLCALDADM